MYVMQLVFLNVHCLAQRCNQLQNTEGNYSITLIFHEKLACVASSPPVMCMGGVRVNRVRGPCTWTMKSILLMMMNMYPCFA